jgi:hypothetical protein
MMIDESLEVPGAIATLKTPVKVGAGDLRTVHRITNLINTMTGARDKNVIDVFEKLVVRLPAKGYGTVEFDMGDERRELLVEAGRTVMRAYLEQAAQAVAPVSFSVEMSTVDLAAVQKADKLALKMLQ